MGNVSGHSQAAKKHPMRIHPICGKNLRITQERLCASRPDGYADGLFFGSRPVERDEQIEITVRKLVKDWNGSVRFGFTIHSPQEISNHAEGIPRYMCPDLIKRGGSYVETISHISLREGDKIVYWVNQSGEVKVKVNDVSQRCQLKTVTREVWPVVDVYGNCTEVYFRSLSDDYASNSESVEPRYYSHLNLFRFTLATNSDSLELIDGIIVDRRRNRKALGWNANPLYVNHIWVLFVKAIDESTNGSLSIGVMASNPSTVSPAPEDLAGYSRRANCVIFNEVYIKMMTSDELAICILDTGVVSVALNGEKFEDIGRVKKGQCYWVIADLNCGIKSLQSVGVHRISRYPLPKMPKINAESFLNTDNFSIASPDSCSNYSSMTAIGGAAGGCGDNDYNSLHRPVVEDKQENKTFEEESYAPRSKSNQSECIICLDSRPDNVFIPCGHMSCCTPCADNLRNEHANNKCPTCRRTIESNMKVFY